MEVRPGTPADLPGILEIQRLSPEASQWNPRDYLGYLLHVAVLGESVAGFIAARLVAPGEVELLNLAVDPLHRRAGVGRTLVRSLSTKFSGDIFLEVRESNSTARKFYQVLGFEEFGTRPGYYETPPEAAVVMKFRSCYCHSRRRSRDGLAATSQRESEDDPPSL